MFRDVPCVHIRKQKKEKRRRPQTHNPSHTHTLTHSHAHTLTLTLAHSHKHSHTPGRELGRWWWQEEQREKGKAQMAACWKRKRHTHQNTVQIHTVFYAPPVNADSPLHFVMPKTAHSPKKESPPRKRTKVMMTGLFGLFGIVAWPPSVEVVVAVAVVVATALLLLLRLRAKRQQAAPRPNPRQQRQLYQQKKLQQQQKQQEHATSLTNADGDEDDEDDEDAHVNHGEDAGDNVSLAPDNHDGKAGRDKATLASFMQPSRHPVFVPECKPLKTLQDLLGAYLCVRE